MTAFRTACLVVLISLTAVATVALAQRGPKPKDPPAPEEHPQPAKPATPKPAADPTEDAKVIEDDSDDTTDTVAGVAPEVLVPVRSTNVSAEIKRYGGELRIKNVVAPGTWVKEGDVLAELDAPELAKDIFVAEGQYEAAKFSENAVKLSLDFARKNQQVQLERVKQDVQVAEEELREFLDGGKADRIASGVMTLESLKASIADQEDELAQLDNLYRGNDLAKESQDIVLKRARRQLAQTKERLRLAERNHGRLLAFELPKDERRLRRAVDERREDLARLEAKIRAGVIDGGMGELNAASIRTQLARMEAEDNLRDLKKVGAQLVLRAPHAGVAVIGPAEGNDGVSQPHKVGDKVARNQPICGVVDITRLRVTLKLPAAKLRKGFEAGSVSTLQRMDESETVSGKITARGFAVGKDGKVSVVFEVDNKDGKIFAGTKVTLKP